MNRAEVHSDGGLLIPKEFHQELESRVKHTTQHWDTEYKCRVNVYNPTQHLVIQKAKPWWKFWEPKQYLIKCK